MTNPTDDELDRALDHAGVGGEQITLKRIGNIAGMALYVDVAGQHDPDGSYNLAIKAFARAFLGYKKGIEKNENNR